MWPFRKVGTSMGWPVMLMCLAAFCGISVVVHGQPLEAEDPDVVDEIPSAAELLADAQALAEAGRWADAAIGCVRMVEEHPETAEALSAHVCVHECLEAIMSTPVRAADNMAVLDAELPAVSDLKSTSAKHLVNTYYLEKGMYLRENVDAEQGDAALLASCDAGLAILQEDQNSPYQVGSAGLFMEAAKARGPEGAKAGIQRLEEFLAWPSSPSVSAWGCHYALADYYLHGGENRQAAEKHLSAMLDAECRGLVKVAVGEHVVPGWLVAAVEWATAYAEFEMGHYDTAIARLDYVAGKYRDVTAPVVWAGSPGAWAAITKPMAIGRKNHGNPKISIEAYLDYLEDNPDGVYTSFAHLSLGELYLNADDLEKAEEHFQRAAFGAGQREAAEAAWNRLEEVEVRKSAVATDQEEVSDAALKWLEAIRGGKASAEGAGKTE